tara:strand:+ start:4652 stop:4957 length:306 start_codon:yes stop_codon:yes gene_type:complete
MNKEKRRQYNIEYQRKRRLDPEYRKAQKLYLKNRRLDPEFIARNKIYLRNFKQKKGEKEKQQKRSREWYHNNKSTQSPKGTDRVEDSILLDNLFNSVLILE